MNTEPPDWIVASVELTTDARRYGKGVCFPFFVRGRNLSDGGREFFWRLPDVWHLPLNPRYDLTNARIDPDVLAMAAGCDGLPEMAYDLALASCRGNLRQLLQKVEAGQLAGAAKAEAGTYLKLPLAQQDATRRAELQSLLKTLES